VNTRVHSKLHKTTTTPTLRLARALSVPLSPFSPNVSCPPALSQAADSGLGAPAPPLMTVHAPPPREEKCCDARCCPAAWSCSGPRQQRKVLRHGAHPGRSYASGTQQLVVTDTERSGLWDGSFSAASATACRLFTGHANYFSPATDGGSPFPQPDPFSARKIFIKKNLENPNIQKKKSLRPRAGGEWVGGVSGGILLAGHTYAPCFFVLCKRHWFNRVPGAHRGDSLHLLGSRGRTVGIPYICKAEGQCMELICPPDWLAKAKMRSSRYCGGRHPSPQDQSFPLQRALRQGLASA